PGKTGAGETNEIEHAWVAVRRFFRVVQDRDRCSMPSGPVQCFGAQEQDYRIRFLYPGQVFERLRSLFLFRGNARQLQVGIGMERIDVEQPLEISLSLAWLS